MDSLYGGHEGISFVLSASFASVDAMVAAFKRGPEYTDAWYGSYVLISTPNLNDEDNGKIYRRGLDFQSAMGGAQLVGQIVGPSSGTPMFQMGTLKETTDKSTMNIGTQDVRTYPYDYSYDDQGRVTGYKVRHDKGTKSYDDGDNLIPDAEKENYPITYFPFSVPHDTSLVPGKKSDGTFNDEIKWTWVNVRKPNQKSESWFYVGFEIPYLWNEYISHMVSPYDANGNLKNEASTATRVDDQTHPFYQKWDFGIPKGIKGDTLRNLRVITPTSANRNNIYLPSAITVDNTSGAATVGAPGYDGLDDDITGQRKILVYDVYIFDTVRNPQPVMIYLGDYNMIESVGVADDGTLTVGYTHNDDTVFTRKIKWVDQVSLNPSTGLFTMTFNNGTPAYTSQLDWVYDITIDEATGEITVHHVDSSKGTNGSVVLPTKLKLITNANSTADGIVTFGTNTGDSIQLNQTGTTDPFRLQRIDDVTFATGIMDDKRLNIKYNTRTTATPIGAPINYVQDMVVRDSDFHLLVLFNDPTHRGTEAGKDDDTGITWINNVTGSDGVNTGLNVYWRDYGTIKDQAGILIGLQLRQEDIDLGPYNGEILQYLDAQYPNGLTEGATKQKIVIYTPTGSSVNEFYAYDYNKNKWFFLGTLSDDGMRDVKLVDSDNYTAADLKNVNPAGIVFKYKATTYSDTAMPEYWSGTYNGWK